MKRNKQGVSLIVLVITIIVMIILAASIIISLSNTNIINKAGEAVKGHNLQEVQQLAALAWADAYVDKQEDASVVLEDRIWETLNANGITKNDYALVVTDTGVTVKEADKTKPVVEAVNLDGLELEVYSAPKSVELKFSDNEQIASINLTTSDITLEGFTATIEITGEGNTRTLTFTNVQTTASESLVHNITIAEGAVIDDSGNKSEEVVFPVTVLPDTEKPVVKADIIKTNEVYTNESVSFKLTFSDNKQLANINLTADDIILEGFTATIEITGEGNTRTVTLSNVQLASGYSVGRHDVIIAEGVVTDAQGNKSSQIAHYVYIYRTIEFPPIPMN